MKAREYDGVLIFNQAFELDPFWILFFLRKDIGNNELSSSLFDQGAPPFNLLGQK